MVTEESIAGRVTARGWQTSVEVTVKEFQISELVTGEEISSQVTVLGTQGVMAEINLGKVGRMGTEQGGAVAAEVIQTSGSQGTAEEVQDDEADLGSQQCQEMLVVGEDEEADRIDHLLAGGVLEESIGAEDSLRRKVV